MNCVDLFTYNIFSNLCNFHVFVVNLNIIDIEFILLYILFVTTDISKYIVDFNIIDVELISIYLLLVLRRYLHIDSIKNCNICLTGIYSDINISSEFIDISIPN